MRHSLRAAFLNQPGHQLADIGGSVLRRHQHGIFRGDHHHIVEPESGHQRPVLTPDIGITDPFQHHIAQRHITVRIRIGRAALPKRGPSAEIGPAAIERNGRRQRGFLHNRVINGIRRYGLEGVLIKA